jgi:ligand-binding sensor domain-containing protein
LNKTILFFCALSSGILLFNSNLNAQTTQFRHYTVNDGLASSSVYFAMQDSKGYMWFCTESGVNRFDGRHFETFTIADGLADNENFKCFEDSKGRVWFMSYNGKLSYYKDTGFVNEKTDPGLKYPNAPGVYIVDMVEDEQENIWFSGFAGSIYQYNGKFVHSYKSALSNGDNKLLLLYNKNIYTLNHRQQGIVHRNKLIDQSEERIYSDEKAGWLIDYICKQRLPSGILYFATSTGLMHMQGDSLITDISNSDLKINGSIGAFKIIGDDLWICAGKAGLFFIPDFLTKGFCGNYQNKLKGSYVCYIATDNEGGIWATSLSEGVYYIPASEVYITNIPGASITSVSHQRESEMLAIGNYYGSFMIRTKQGLATQVQLRSPTVNRIKALKWLSAETLLVGTDIESYLYDVPGKRFSVLHPMSNMYSFCGMDKVDEGLLVAGRSQILLFNDQQSRIVYRNNNPNEKIISIAGDSHSRCWFADINNLHQLDFITGTSVRIAGDEIFHANLKDIRSVNGDLWVATDGNGIFILRYGKVIKHIYSDNEHMGSNICRKLVYDGKDKVWAATNKGINVYDIYSYACIKRYTNDILISDDVKDIDLDNGKAYVATSAGVSIIDIRKFISMAAPPKVYIKYLSANNIFYNHAITPVFDYFKGVVKVSYTAITFQANQSLTYRYKLDDQNSTWNETNAAQIEFYNLNPGKYTLLIAAKKYNSNWCAPFSYTFTILPLWYQSWWFKVSVCLSFLVVLYVWIARIRWREKEKTAYNKRIASLRSNALASQMNPHFIFNTLNSLQTFVLLNKPLAANHYIAKFSALVRWIMNYSAKQRITLAMELEFLKTYIELEQLRFEEQFTALIEVDEDLHAADIYIPSLIIQPFVENAIKYGLTGKKEKGLLKIVFKQQSSCVLVTIEDNGIGRARVLQEQQASHKAFESTGIKNTEERLQLISGGRGKDKLVEIIDLYEHENPTGTKVVLIIPILQ